MGWWPFGRKKRKNKKAEKAERAATARSEKPVAREKPLETQQHRISQRPVPASTNPFNDPPPSSEKPVPSRQPPPRPPRSPPRQPSVEDITALPQSPRRPHNPPLQALGDTELNQPRAAEPTLVRQKTRQKHEDDQLREEQIRSMTASSPIPIPNRSGADSPRLYRRDSKRKRGDSHRQLPDPSSTVSLPAPPSVRSSMTQFSDSHHVEVGSVDVLSPRPKLRYSIHGSYPSGALRSSAPSRSDSRKERPFSRRTIDETNTIDEYADDMDAKTLRELMERDQRRRDRKRKTDSDRARHKLEREANRRGGGEPDTQRRRRRDIETKQVEDPALIGSSGTKKEYAAEPVEPVRPVTARRVDPSEDPFADGNAQASLVEAPSALQQTHPEPIPTIPYSSTTAEESPPVTPFRHVRQQSSLSQSTDPRAGSFQDLSKTISEGRRSSRLGTSKRTGALSALFRRSGIGKRDSQQTFSNTSRESMAARYTPPPDNSERTYRRASSGTPIRTKSKFRENLDDEPVPIPDTYPRPPTPVEEVVPPLPSEQDRFPEAGHPSRSQRESYDSTHAPSAALLSQSLASVDSEGSWLSGGRPKKRVSQQMSLGRSSLAQRPSTLEDPSMDDLGIYEDSSGRRSEGPIQPAQGQSRVRSLTSIEADDDARSPSAFEEGEAQVTEGQVSRRPTVVHRQPRIHSSEGLLRDMLAEDPDATAATTSEQYETADDATPEQTTPEAVAEIQSATQGYGLTHARSISAGSARLLDIPSRRESWRRSAARTPSPTFEDRPSQP